MFVFASAIETAHERHECHLGEGLTMKRFVEDQASQSACSSTNGDVFVWVEAPIPFEWPAFRSPLISLGSSAAEDALVDADELSIFLCCLHQVRLKLLDALKLLLRRPKGVRTKASFRELQGDASALVDASELVGVDGLPPPLAEGQCSCLERHADLMVEGVPRYHDVYLVLIEVEILDGPAFPPSQLLHFAFSAFVVGFGDPPDGVRREAQELRRAGHSRPFWKHSTCISPGLHLSARIELEALVAGHLLEDALPEVLLRLAEGEPALYRLLGEVEGRRTLFLLRSSCSFLCFSLR